MTSEVWQLCCDWLFCQIFLEYSIDECVMKVPTIVEMSDLVWTEKITNYLRYIHVKWIYFG